MDKPARFLMFALGAALLVGCGDGTGGGALNVSGRVNDAIVVNGKVNITALDADGGFLQFLGSVRTDANGNFQGPAHNGPMKLEVVSGTYTDPATGATVNLAERGALLMAMSKAIHAHREELLDLAAANGGNTRGDGKFDIDGATSTLAYYAKLADDLGEGGPFVGHQVSSEPFPSRKASRARSPAPRRLSSKVKPCSKR